MICPYITGSKNTAPGWGLNQQQMGALVGTSRQTISQIERGDYSPSVTLARQAGPGLRGPGGGYFPV